MINANGGSITYTVKVDASGAVTGIKQAESKMVSASETAGTKSGGKMSKAWAVATGAIVGVTSQVFSKVSSVISQNLSAGIARADIMNNYVNVMSNLGIGADAAKKSVDQLSDGLDGLPTALDTASLAVQRLTATNGDVEKSTNQFLALNNAILAGGAPADIQTTAIEQLMQAYAKGKPDMMEWRSLMSAMPAQLTQVAQAMGYDNADSLGSALRDGSLSMDEFLGKITELNEEGTGEFLSFAEQAKNATGGIQTQLANLNTAITRIITDALNGEDISKNLDKFVNQFNNVAPRIIEAVIKVGAGIIGAIPKMLPGIIQAIMNTLPDIVEAAKQLIVGLAQELPNIMLIIIEALPSIIDAIGEAIPAIVDAICAMFEDEETLNKLIDAWVNVVIAIANNLPKILEAIAQAIPRIIEALVEFLANPENIAKLAGAALQLFGALVTSLFTIIGALLSGLGEGLAKLWNFITSHLGEWLSGIGQWAGELWNNIVNVFSGVGQWFTNTFQGAIDGIKNVFSGIGQWFQDRWNDVTNVFSNVWNTFTDIGRNIWEGLKSGIGNLAENIKNMFTGAVDSVKQFLGIASPSKLFASLGNYVGEGFVEGLEKQTENAQRALNDLTGGINTTGTVSLAYETGQVPMNGLFDSGARIGGNTYNINISGTFATSPDERRKVADQIVEAIELNNRRRFA